MTKIKNKSKLRNCAHLSAFPSAHLSAQYQKIATRVSALVHLERSMDVAYFHKRRRML